MASESAKQFVQVFFNQIMFPLLKKSFSHSKKKNNIENSIADLFQEYILKSYEIHSSINILALGNKQINLNDVYQPLTLRKEESHNSEVRVNSFPGKMANKYKKIIIEDQAGMGKSTLMKKLFISCIEDKYGIPIFLELRKLTEDDDLSEFIFNSVNSVKKINDGQLLDDIFNNGGFVFLFDGYDEIPSAIKERITDKLQEFIGKASGNNYFFITSRPDPSLVSFGDFQKFEIKNLRPPESFEMFKKYDKRTRFQISNDLISHCEEALELKTFKDLKYFLGNPLLVSFIYITYRYKRDIPINKSEFYRKVYDALFEDHDYSKGGWNRKKYSKLSRESFHKFLRNLAFRCLSNNKIDFSKDQLINLIERAQKSVYFEEVDSSDIFRDLVESVPLIVQDGLSYKWAHKSFMEYFSASFIYSDCTSKKDEVLLKLYKSKNITFYENVLDIFYDIDQEAFNRVIIKPLINDYLNFLGDTTIVDKLELQYKQYTYLRIFYKGDNIPLGDDRYKDSTGEIRHKVGSDLHTISSRYAIITNSDENDEGNTPLPDYILPEFQFTNEPNKITIINILINKKSNLIREYSSSKLLGNEEQCEGECIISYMDDLAVLSKEEIEKRINTLVATNFEYDFYLDLKEAKAYLEKIELHSSIVEESLFEID